MSDLELEYFRKCNIYTGSGEDLVKSRTESKEDDEDEDEDRLDVVGLDVSPGKVITVCRVSVV